MGAELVGGGDPVRDEVAAGSYGRAHRGGRSRVADQGPQPVSILSAGSLVAQLRRAAADEATGDALRLAAAQRLADLADAVDDVGDPLVPSASPTRWWGLAARVAGAACRCARSTARSLLRVRGLVVR